MVSRIFDSMKIQVLSDLHREFGSLDISFSKADVVILAGDVDLGTKGIDWILATIKNIPVIYVLGNHEYYRGSYPKTLNQIKERAAGTHVHVLENDSVILHGVAFHGATLWTNFELLGDARINGSICQERMNDYRLIRRDPSYSKLRSIDTSLMHHQSVNWLQSSLDSSPASTDIVVTHHAPSARSLPEDRKHDVLSSAYASNLETTILKHEPMYWIHGHIHTPARYCVGKTTVLCNPHGYIMDPPDGFEAELFIDI